MSGGRVYWSAAVRRAALVGLILVLVGIAYYPFAWSPPRTVANQVTRNADGSLGFGGMNNARTPGTPAWVDAARTHGVIQIQLQADPQAQQTAAIMTLATDYWHTDFSIGQHHSDLLVWLRRPGSDANGGPPFDIGGVFQPQRWSSVNMMLRNGDLLVEVDGRTRMSQQLPADFLRVWGHGQLALGDEVHGGGPWRGRINLAQVRTPGQSLDYVRPGELSIPARYLYLPDHIEPFPPGDIDWLTAFLDLVSFVPLGFLLVAVRKPPVRPVPAVFVTGVFAVGLAAGKFLFHGRHAGVLNMVLEIIGGVLGILLARTVARRYTRDVTAASVPGI